MNVAADSRHAFSLKVRFGPGSLFLDDLTGTGEIEKISVK
jgi:hypothetical protein